MTRIKNSGKNSRPLKYSDYIKGTRQVLEQSKNEKKSYVVSILGEKYVVFPNVFSPKYFKDTELFAENFPVKKGEEILEIGPGTGVISITAIKNGAKKVLAIDINPNAVKNTQKNIEIHKLHDKMEVRLGDVYDAVKPNEKFDTIFWNTPFGLVANEEIPDLEKSVYDPGYKSTEKFIKEAKEHLKQNGRLLIGFSSTLGRLDLIKKFTEEAGFDLNLIYEVESEEVYPVKFEIFEAKLKQMKNIYILGINSAYHESSATLIKNGKLIAAVEEERFNRIKHAKKARVDNPDDLPLKSINFCLKEAKISFSDLNYIAFSFNPKKRLKNIGISRYSAKDSWGTEKGEKIFYNKLISVPKKLEKIYGAPVKNKFIWVDHHLAHAAGSFFVSPYKESLIIVVDGIGENATAWIGYGKENKLYKLKEIYYPDSLGFLWEKFSEYLGFTEYDSGKIMGLTSYGDWKVYWDKFSKIVTFDKDNIFGINNDILKFRTKDFSKIESLFGVKRRENSQTITKDHQHIAASLQKISQKTILRLVKFALDKYPCENLCLNGGVILNCIANEELFSKLQISDIFIPPATHDGGTSMGAAYYVWNQNLNKERSFILDNPYMGPKFDSKSIEKVLKEDGLKFQKIKNIEKRVAELIANGNIVAWFQGRMEFGPRALGNRSILADPRKENMRKVLNTKVKHREYFRPFAPSVLEERAGEWFYLKKCLLPDRFMLFAVTSIYPEKIPAVTHIDETCRIQIVNNKINPKFHALIKEFEKITGIPIVLNTSFNIQEPIVCTPQDAIVTFKRSKIDYLAIGDYLVKNSQKYCQKAKKGRYLIKRAYTGGI